MKKILFLFTMFFLMMFCNIAYADMTEVSTLTLNAEEIGSGCEGLVINGSNAFVTTFETSPATTDVVKFDLDNFQRISSVALDSDVSYVYCTTSDGTHCYVFSKLPSSSYAKVIKIRLSDMVNVASVTLNDCGPYSAFGITNDGVYAYVTTETSSPNTVLSKIRLSNMTIVGSITFTDAYGARGITNDGTYAYIAISATSAPKIIKVRLSDLVRIQTLTPSLVPNFITNDGTYAYASTNTTPAKVIKIKLSDMTEISTLTLDEGENYGHAIINDGTYAYLGVNTSPGKIIKIRLSDLTKVQTITFATGENSTQGLAIYGNYLYASLNSNPTKIIKIALNNIEPPTNLSATPGDSQVNLTWDTISNATGYNVKRSTTSGGNYETISTNVTSNSYTDNSVTNDITYYYVVTAVNTGSESANSNETSATPQLPQQNGNKALLLITMTNGTEKEYELTITDINAFITWYNGRASGSGTPYYTISKSYNLGPFLSRKDYIVFDKILSFEVMEYTK